MAKFLFISGGYFVNVDMITSMKINGQIGHLKSMDVWFAGNTAESPGLTLRFEDADEMFDELMKIHTTIGWTASKEDLSNAEPEKKE